MLASYGIKGVALWVISYVGGIFLIYHLWPSLLHAWFTLVPISFSLTTRHRYKKYYAPNPINSEEMWELEKAARKHAEDKAFDESRAIVPKHVETDEPSPDNKNQTP